MKFGGSSVANADNIAKIIALAEQSQKNNESIVFVVSALSGITDGLIALANKSANGDISYQGDYSDILKQHQAVIDAMIHSDQKPIVETQVKQKFDELKTMLDGVYLIKEVSPRSLDCIASFGEQLSAYIIGEAMNSSNIACRFIDSRQIVKTDNAFGSANVDITKTYTAIAEAVKNSPHSFCIMGGFIGSTTDGITTTLGRGGSDYTASLVGAAVDAEVIEIWTDVDGVLTADPRKVPEAFSLEEISYEEAAELAHFGAKVIHPKTMRPARLKNIPIIIKNTFNPGAAGTKICNTVADHVFPIKGISTLSKVSLLQIQSNNGKTSSTIGARLFDILSRAGIEVLLTTQASHEQAICVAVQSDQANTAKQLVEAAFELEIHNDQILPLNLENDLSIIAIVGKQMKGTPGISGKFFSVLGKNRVNIVAIAQGSSELNVSAVIKSEDETKALRYVHQKFFSIERQPLNVYLVGTGLIGSTVLKEAQKLKDSMRFCGLADQAKMVINPEGIDLENWKATIDEGSPANLEEFMNAIIENNLLNTVFVDCTASEDIVKMYDRILSANMAIVTPNKKANSGPFVQFKRLHELSQRYQAPFLYETNVGAGLPVIHTIQSLVSSGDKVTKIEAILSGSLSFIFNTFANSDRPFSEIVAEAKTQGYTEPDPRDDLSGKDVARKIIILARETGLAMELDDVQIDPLLPESCLQATSVDEFFVELKKLDEEFAQKKQTAQAENKVLRFIASLENGQAKISLQSVTASHPFFNMSGSDNIIAFSTERYCNTPLVIKGPGAGAEVTAGGVLADIISIYNSKAYEQR